MSIKDQLTEDMKQAMKDREAGKLRLSVIRMVRANIKNVEINEKKELNDDEDRKSTRLNSSHAT